MPTNSLIILPSHSVSWFLSPCSWACWVTCFQKLSHKGAAYRPSLSSLSVHLWKARHHIVRTPAALTSHLSEPPQNGVHPTQSGLWTRVSQLQHSWHLGLDHFLCVLSSLVHYGRFSNISDLHSLGAESTHNTLLVIITYVFRHCQMSPEGQSHSQLTATVLDDCSPGRPLTLTSWTRISQLNCFWIPDPQKLWDNKPLSSQGWFIMQP